MSKYKSVLLIFFYFLLFVSMGFKNDINELRSSFYFSSLEYPYYVEFMKNKSLYIFGFSVLIGFFLVFDSYLNNFKIILNKYTFFFFFLTILFFIRSFFYDYDFGIKILQSIFIYFLVFMIVAKINYKYGTIDHNKRFIFSINIFSIFYVTVCFISYIQGYGFVDGNPRYFGVTIHPNYMGVNLAICSFILLYNMINLGFKCNIPFLIFGLYLLLITGSRNSLVLFSVSLLFLCIYTKSILMKFFSLFFILIFSIYLYLLKDSSQFDRGVGGQNTRAEAWYSMINMIEINPFFGVGYFKGDSENSYMRVAVAFGLPISLLFIVLIIKLIHFYNKQKNIDKSNYSLLAFCLLAGISCSAFFEGYLMDLWSLPKIVFLMLIFLAIKQSNFQIELKNKVV